MDDENVDGAPAMALYTPYRGKGLPMRMFVRTSGDPYALVPPVTRIIRELSANQAVERPATLEDVRAEVLTPERLNAFVVSGFAGIALLIAVVGVSGVLAFSRQRAHARVRRAAGDRVDAATPADAASCRRARPSWRSASPPASRAAMRSPAWRRAISRTCACRASLPVLAAAAVLAGAAVVASLMPAARASRVDVLQALRSE